MTDPSDLNPAENTTPTFKDQLELLKFLREEARANQDALNKQASADRELFKSTLQLVTWPLTAMLVIA